jgi:hypothetical protein
MAGTRNSPKVWLGAGAMVMVAFAIGALLSLADEGGQPPLDGTPRPPYAGPPKMALPGSGSGPAQITLGAAASTISVTSLRR